MKGGAFEGKLTVGASEVIKCAALLGRGCLSKAEGVLGQEIF